MVKKQVKKSPHFVCFCYPSCCFPIASFLPAFIMHHHSPAPLAQSKHKTVSMHEFSSLDLQGPRARPISQTKTLHKDLSVSPTEFTEQGKKSTDSTSQTLTYDRVQQHNTSSEIECVYVGYRHWRTGMQKTGIFSLNEDMSRSQIRS